MQARSEVSMLRHIVDDRRSFKYRSGWQILVFKMQTHYNQQMMGTSQKKSKHNEKEKPNWDWTHIEGYLRTTESSRKSTVWNLSPSIILTNPSTNANGPVVRLYIDTEKSLQYSTELGWNWHKSWNIPNISLRLEIKDENTGDFLLSPRNLFAQIFAVKRCNEEKSDRITLVDVGIRGESKMEMMECHVYFSAIKFSSTTYNNQGINFNLLIVLYINEPETEKPRVLTAVISPPIFVDSRRSARDHQDKKFSSFVEPFMHDNLEKEFIKRENKSKCESEILIRNDSEGFYNYITAPNIRHKVKHPLFLAIKFSNCVRVYMNSTIFQKMTMQQLIEDLQTKLLKETRNRSKDEELVGNLQDKSFVFAITNLEDSLKRKKVIESIETMQNEFIGITCNPEELHQNFTPLEVTDELKKAYKDSYESLINICHNYEPEYPEDSEQEADYTEQEDDNSESSRKVKKEEMKIRTRAMPTREKIDKHLQNIATTKGGLKKEEIFEAEFQAPIFFPHVEGEVTPRKASSAFNKISAPKNTPNNTPVFDTQNLNKTFANIMGCGGFQYSDLNNVNQIHPFFMEGNNGFKQNQKMFRGNANVGMPKPTNNISPAQSMNGFGGNQASIFDSLQYNNMILSNSLNSVKVANINLYENTPNNTISDHILHRNSLESFMHAEQQARTPQQNGEQQYVVSLFQQIALYKELLTQVTYQNQLLTRNLNFLQQTLSNRSYEMNPSLSQMYPQFGMNMGQNTLQNQSKNMNQMMQKPMQDSMQTLLQQVMQANFQNNFNSMSNGMQNGMQNGMPNGMLNGMLNGMPNGMSNAPNARQNVMQSNLQNGLPMQANLYNGSSMQSKANVNFSSEGLPSQSKPGSASEMKKDDKEISRHVTPISVVSFNGENGVQSYDSQKKEDKN